jgi:hypothetical protein
VRAQLPHTGIEGRRRRRPSARLGIHADSGHSSSFISISSRGAVEEQLAFLSDGSTATGITGRRASCVMHIT